MLNWLSVNALLKSIIVALSAVVVVVLSLGAWDSWHRMAVASRIAAAAEASTHLFTALHNMRVDRSSTNRDLLSDRQLTEMSPMLKQARDAEMPALKAGLAVLANTTFPEKDAAISGLDQAIKKLTALHTELATAFLQPKSARRPGIAQESFQHIDNTINLLDKILSQLTRSVKLEDAFIDQLMELKQLAWMARNAGGDASVAVSNILGGQPAAPDTMANYTANVAKLDILWAALTDLADGLPLPARFSEAVQKAQQGFMSPDYVALRLKTLTSLLAGEKAQHTLNEWSTLSVAKLASLLGVAETALDIAKDHASSQQAQAMWKLGVQLAILVAALAIAGGMMLVVSRRVTGPLQQMQQAMVKLADGNFEVVLPGLGRKDEIGEVARRSRVQGRSAEKARAEARPTPTANCEERRSPSATVLRRKKRP